MVSKIVCDRPPLTSDIRHVSKSSNGTDAARSPLYAKLLLSSAKYSEN